MPTQPRSRLTAQRVRSLNTPGRYADGNGLYLQITKRTLADGRELQGKSWLLRYRINAKSRSMGLGSVEDVPLKDARIAAANAQALLQRGIDPKAQRDLERAQVRREADNVAEHEASVPNFREASRHFIAARRAEWKNAKHVQQWENTLEAYAHPVIGAKKVDTITVQDVFHILDPIWRSKTETATRVRGRIEEIMSWSAAHGHCDSDNPARWNGRLRHMLPAPNKVRKVRHHPALPFAELPEFMRKLYSRNQTEARDALTLGILTALRAGEVRYARAREFKLDDEGSVWEVPGERMKMGVTHRVPLSQQAAEIVRPRIDPNRPNAYVFSQRYGKAISENATRMVLKAMGRLDITTHGFRSTFRDWAAERTHFALEVIELSLAHKTKSNVEAAYWRSDIVEKRAALMQQWADFATSQVPVDLSQREKLMQLLEDSDDERPLCVAEDAEQPTCESSESD